MKIHFLERDGRKNDPDFKQTMGSFSVICSILEKGLRNNGVYTDNIAEADWVGIADSLATDFHIPGKRCFGIYFVDTANTIPKVALDRLAYNPNLRLFSINQHTADLYRKYGLECTAIGPGVDSDFWTPGDGTKNKKFTFLHTGFSNIRSGLDQLLAAYNYAFRDNNDVRLVVKDTSQSPILKQRIRDLQERHDIVHLTQRMTNVQVRELYRKSHVLCSVFRHSGHGLPIGEAACCNCLPLVGDFAPSNEIANDYFSAFVKPAQTYSILEMRQALVNTWGLTDTFGSLGFPEEPLVHCYRMEDIAKQLKLVIAQYKNYDNIRENALKVWDYQKSANNLMNLLKIS